MKALQGYLLEEPIYALQTESNLDNAQQKTWVYIS